MMRLDRNRRGPDSTLDHRMTVFVLGAAVALVGIASGNRIIVYVALVILVVGVVLRLVTARRAEREMDEQGADDEGHRSG